MIMSVVTISVQLCDVPVTIKTVLISILCYQQCPTSVPLQVGTVVEGNTDFYSGRLTKKERKQTFADELLANSQLKSFR